MTRLTRPKLPAHYLSICFLQYPHLSLQTEHCREFAQGHLMTSQQKGGQQGSFGAKDQLLINKLLTKDSMSRHRSLSKAWVDYQKVYDRVSHSWLLRCLQLHKISLVRCRFLSRLMKSWKTSMVLSYGNGAIKTRLTRIKRGILKGDLL